MTHDDKKADPLLSRASILCMLLEKADARHVLYSHCVGTFGHVWQQRELSQALAEAQLECQHLRHLHHSIYFARILLQ